MNFLLFFVYQFPSSLSIFLLCLFFSLTLPVLGRIVFFSFPCFVFSLFVLQEYIFQWIKNPKGKLIKVRVLQEPNTELEISLRPMKYLKEEQQSQQLLERNLNAYKSMRDYRNPPWMSLLSCMVPPTNAPYGNSYKPSWRNHLNLSWGP